MSWYQRLEPIRPYIPKPARTAAWKTARWLRSERPGLLMWFAGPAPEPVEPPAGFSLRTWESGDDLAWLQMLNESGAFGAWDEARLARETRGLFPGGQFFVADGENLVAGTGIFDRPVGRRTALEIGWIVRHPAAAGKHLGLVTVVAAVRFGLSLPGERPVYVYTDDHRLTAIRMYLDLGFVPDLRSHRSYAKRWDGVFRELALRGRPAPAG